MLVFDLGGGTFDVTLGVLSSGEVAIKAIAGDTRLGGADFDALLRDKFVQVIKAEYGPSKLSLLHSLHAEECSA